MTNILEYMKWRDDLKFEENAPNIIDYFILGLLPIIDFRKELNKDSKVTIEELSKLYFTNNPSIEKLGLIIPSKMISLFKLLGTSNRFKDICIDNYVCDISLEEEKQFCAMTFHLPNNEIFVAFSGTDDTIIGWKENLDMMYKKFIPAQLEGISYLDNLQEDYQDIKCGGHSKGGNLALVSSAFTKKKIKKVFCFDSPGVNKEIYESTEYKQILEDVITILPDSSVVGRTFNIPDKVLIVKSNQKGVYQHDPFSWEIIKNNFMYLGKPNPDCLEFQKGLNDIIDEMTLEERKGFSEAMYKILRGTNNYSLLDLEGRVLTLISGYFKLSKEDKQLLIKPYKKLIKIKSFKNAFLKGFIEYRKSQKK